MRRSPLLAVLVLAPVLVTACGDDSEDTNSASKPAADASQGTETSDGSAGGGTKAATDCVEAWNTGASKDVKSRASLSHRGDAEPDVRVGTYPGEPFDAVGEAFDAGGSTTSADISVAKGDCVATDLTSNDTETNWVMVQPSGGKDWYFLDPTADHPLAKPPQKLDGEQTVGIKGGFGDEEAKLEP